MRMQNHNEVPLPSLKLQHSLQLNLCDTCTSIEGVPAPPLHTAVTRKRDMGAWHKGRCDVPASGSCAFLALPQLQLAFPLLCAGQQRTPPTEAGCPTIPDHATFCPCHSCKQPCMFYCSLTGQCLCKNTPCIDDTIKQQDMLQVAGLLLLRSLLKECLLPT